jgi:hypothetical protein
MNLIKKWSRQQSPSGLATIGVVMHKTLDALEEIAATRPERQRLYPLPVTRVAKKAYAVLLNLIDELEYIMNLAKRKAKVAPPEIKSDKPRELDPTEKRPFLEIDHYKRRPNNVT